MTIGEMIYKLLLGPLELLFDVVYTVAYRLTANPGLAIIFLSLAINFLILPLYRRADALQEEERVQSLKLKPGIDHIKKMFKGDERFMILQTYYRQNNYKPYYALKGSVSLLLEIPFFIAAYHFLSGLGILQGAAFGPIADLGSPDRLIQLGGVSINLLPILMTVINIISGAVYTKGMPLKSKIQLYGMALIFLVLLYQSPSGLVFYWTLNNLFSLVKNVFYKIPNPRKVLGWLCSATGLALFLFFCLIHPVAGMRRKTVITVAFLLMQLPLISGCLKRERIPEGSGTETKTTKTAFYVCCTFLTFLLGILIPSAIIAASPGEFVEMSDFHSPLRYLVSSGLLATGTFLIWCGIFYKLSSEKGRYWFSLAALIISTAAVVDYMFFGNNYGNLSPMLKYDLPIINIPVNYLVNTSVLVALAGLVYLIWKKKPELVKAICFSGCIAVIVMASMNVSNIRQRVVELETLSKQQSDENARFCLSKKGKNVVVIMLDRAIGGYVPFLFDEKPELQRQFSGFTYYPNTLSYGSHTNVGSPPLYGGYDYIPDEINSRTDTLLKDKQNEALKIMPVNFYENGYEVTVCDPTFANYMWVPDLSIYEDYPDMHTYNTKTQCTGLEKVTIPMEYSVWNRNFFCYSIFRAAPLLLQDDLYDEGVYLSSQRSNLFDTPQIIESVYTSHGVDTGFMRDYSILNRLPDMTVIDDSRENTFMMMSNDITHEPMLVQTPDYVPQNIVDNTAYEAEHAVRYSLSRDELRLKESRPMIHYHAMMAAFIQLGNWFDFLRENDVWDNTRIILVSDHGFFFGELFNMKLDGPSFNENDEAESYLDLLSYNPLFMVKDFNSMEFSTDASFMTNADTPLQAFSGLIANPVNPFLNRPITDAHKYDAEQHILSCDWHIEDFMNYSSFEEVSEERWTKSWLTLRNADIFDLKKWTVEKK